MPTTDINKIIGFIVGVLCGYLAKTQWAVPVEVQGSITLGVSMLVGAVVGKFTNPTGANTAEARKALEQQTQTGQKGE